MRGDSPACLRRPEALLAHVPVFVSSCLTTSSCWERAILWVAVAEIVSDTEIANNVSSKHPAPHALASCQLQRSVVLLTATSSKATACINAECPRASPAALPQGRERWSRGCGAGDSVLDPVPCCPPVSTVHRALRGDLQRQRPSECCGLLQAICW